MLRTPKSALSVAAAVMFCEACFCQIAETPSAFAQTAENKAVVPDRFSQYATIFVAYLDTMRPVAECKNPLPDLLCRQDTTVRVTRILKGRDRQVPIEFEAVLPPPTPLGFISQPQGWQTETQIKANRSYLIFSKEQKQLKLSFETPEAVFLLQDNEDAAGDIALILGGSAVSLQDQISRVVGAISAGGKSRSIFLAQHASDLLKFGSESETAALSQTIENAGEDTFSSMAKQTLLFRLRELSSDPDRRAGNQKHLWHLLVALTASYLIGGPDHPIEGEPSSDSEVQKSVWVIRTSANGDSEFRAALEALGHSSKRRLTSQQEARVPEWLQILNQR
jgi:hypothetical protein